MFNEKKKLLFIASKYILFLLIVTVLLLGLYLYRRNKKLDDGLSSALHKNELLIDYAIDEPLAYTLVSKNGVYDYGDYFVVFERKNNSWHRIYENDFKDLMPWKLELADVDGDNTGEILIAVKKTTYFDKEIKNRMFIFNYQDGILVKKWTGSQIAGTWRDFYSGNLLSVKGDELIFIEKTKDDKECISVYSWFDFGFFRIAESEAYSRIHDPTIVADNRLEIIYYHEGEEMNMVLTAVDGMLIPLNIDK